jgi:hypothetical protein
MSANRAVLPHARTAMRKDVAVDALSQSEAIEQLITSAGSAVSVLRNIVSAVPAGTRATPADPDRRRDAYIAFQKAALRASTHVAYVIELSTISRKPIIFGGVWGSLARLMDAMRDTEQILADLLGALAEVRIVGNPAPRAKAEEIIVVLLKMQETIPVALRKATRDAKAEDFGRWQSRFGLEQKNFAEIVREDLKYAGKPRHHWWQLWRPREREPWPGGWPGPTLELDAEPNTVGGPSAADHAGGPTD